LRDFSRRRAGLVEEGASCYSSLRMQFIRYNQNSMSLNALKHFTPDDIEAVSLPLELKEYCKMTLERIDLLSRQIRDIDKYLKTVTLDEPNFRAMLTIPGIHYVLGLTIYYEVGDILRFKSAKHLASYCRLVPGISQSSDKIKRGKGSKQGNHYLKWAFSQAANMAVRYYPRLRKFRDKHANRRKSNAHILVANCILAHKLATAAFHILRDGVVFEESRLLG